MDSFIVKNQNQGKIAIPHNARELENQIKQTESFDRPSITATEILDEMIQQKKKNYFLIPSNLSILS